MARVSPTLVDPAVARQLRRARWRRNLLELQRALYLALAALGVGATVLLVAALRTSATVFVLVAAAVVAALLGDALYAGRRLRRAWLGPDRAVHWVDGAAGLQGRLVTLVELGARGVERAAPPFFLPLLEAQLDERRDGFAPERLVPEALPPAALGAAIAAASAFLLAVALAPSLLPRVPLVVAGDEPIELAGVRGLPRDPERLAVAPWAPAVEGGEESAAGGPATPGEDGASASAFARLAAGLQDRIRHQLWGDAWARQREALARIERERARARAERQPEREEAGGAWEEARAERARPGGALPGAGSDGEPAERRERAAGEGGPGAPGAGAGTDTDPELFATAVAAADGSDERFDLAIAARVRAQRAGPRRPSGPAPPAAPDMRPGLATRQRPEAAIPRLAVPAGYEPIVHDLFARREPTRASTP